MDFLWGAATSAYQIEGSTTAHGRGPSIWDEFCRRPDAIRDGSSGEAACDHVNRFRDDVALMRDMGLTAYRFSISWPRVMPEGTGHVNEPGVAFYDRLVDTLLDAGIDPAITLFHWDLPVALHRRGGWLSPASPEWFEEYARVVVDRLSDRVTTWMTINEPQVFLGLGYGSAEHAPGLRLDWSEQVALAHHVLLAHGLAVRTIREHARVSPRIGWAPVAIMRAPAEETAAHVEAARRATFASSAPSIWSNAWFNDPAVLGRYPEDGLRAHAKHLPRGWERDLQLIAQPMDFLGFNQYQCDFIEPDENGRPRVVPHPVGAQRTMMRWPVTPAGMYWSCRFLHERYQLPLLIAENGVSCHDWPSEDGAIHDPQRISFVSRYLRSLKRALDEGIPVLGYFHWSLLDNFEWAEGYMQRFGLVHVDFQTQQRTLKDSARWYAEVIQSNGASIESDQTPATAGYDVRSSRARPE